MRLRIAIELLRSVSSSVALAAMPRAANSRLAFDRIAITPAGVVYAMPPGDSSGAALVLWEILAGHALGVDRPHRLHAVVDDMPADVDDLVMNAIESDDEMSAAQLYEGLLSAGEHYAHTLREATASLPWVEGNPVEARQTPPPAAMRNPVPLSQPPPSSRAPRSAGRGALVAGDAARGPASARSAVASASPQSTRPPGSGGRAQRSQPASPAGEAVHGSSSARPSSRPNSSRPASAPRENTNVASAKSNSPKTSATLPSMRAVSLATPAAPQAAAPNPKVAPAPVSSGRPSVRPSSARRGSLATVPPPDEEVRREPIVLLIHGGEQAGQLADALRGVGYEVVVRRDAAGGYAYAVAHNPMCIVCDSDLPDADGEAVVRKVRAHATGVAHTPFMLLASRADTRKRVARFGAGADVCLIKPIRASVMIKQVDALVDMSSRLRAAHEAVSAIPQVSSSAACSGDVRQVGIGVMLTIFEMERRTGLFAASLDGEEPVSARVSISDLGKDTRLELDLASGCVAGATAMGVPTPPIDVVRAMLRMTEGRFVFKPTKMRYVDAPRLSEVLAEAARLEDEARATRG